MMDGFRTFLTISLVLIYFKICCKRITVPLLFLPLNEYKNFWSSVEDSVMLFLRRN